MKVYYNGDAPNIGLSVCPGGHLPAAECPRDWFEEDGKTPRTFPIKFEGGEAIVSSALGKYLVAERICRTSKILLPEHVRRLVA